ncbi:cytochrome c oxidase subunit II [Atopomonas sediminilitoris]|uniref:cytochrome c oxidase subunit II n=1 Tax=Atopomonas sediminilitoris TaxID=2919919 RepID=UPI001F4EAAE0|nr:cytochrome c oxidase subunit II [Atopomonas sediminilitoris]MCJ8170580.1 cytochrome c oxidase subunit II [Atopomonas sediminilitoris]
MLRRPVLAGLLLACASFTVQAEWAVNMRPGVTDISQSVFDLHMIIFWICVAIGVVVFGVMFWSMLIHRRSSGQQPAHFHESTSVEVLWTVLPLVILLAMAVPATKTLIEIYDTSEADLDIQITGYQWKWQYKYLGEDVAFFSNLSTPSTQIHNQDDKGEHYLLEVDEPLVIPAGKKVRFLITAADVIHAWWVPDLAVKKDAIPGFINESWTKVDKPGIYRGQCAELCGKDHGFMPIVVDVKTPEDYAAWLAEKKAAAAAQRELTSKNWTLDELMARGEKAYQSNCAACHQASGEGMPPVFPALKGSAIATGPIDGHLDIVFNGKPGTAMAAYGKQLSEVDIAAIITYERNAWGNALGDMLTPQDVVKYKQAQE